jgi:hypothetical protein
VVVELPKIALQLTDAPDATKITAVTSATDSTITTTTSTTVAVPVAVDTTNAERPKKEENRMVDGDREEKNKNRAGLRVCFNMFPGERRHWVRREGTLYGASIDTTIKANEENAVDGGSVAPQIAIKAVIPIGKFVTIDAGIGTQFARDAYEYTYWDSTYYTTGTNTESFVLIAPSLSLGANFVARIYPLKINAGILTDLTWGIQYWNFDYGNLYMIDTMAFRSTFAAGIGARAGVELMAGPHLGLAVDFIIRRLKFEFLTSEETGTDEYYNYYDNKFYWQVALPPIGVGFSMNFYF